VDTETAAMPLTGSTFAAPGSDDSLTRAQRGELAAFDQLMREHEARVFSIALRFTGRRADAEELTQDVFVQLHGGLSRISDAEHLRRWLLRTVTHRCLNRLRDQRRRPQLVPIETLPATAEPVAPESGSDPLAGPHLRRLLLELAPEARLVLLLRFQEDLDPSDIAAALDMSVNTVKSHLRRSLEWLRAQCTGDAHGA
jgi:RNA polymerase sigma-70 factor (ECF subfamily)